MTAKISLAGPEGSQRLHGASQSRAIRCGHCRRGRTFRALLTERQVATEDAYSLVAKGTRDCDQQRRLAIAAGAVRYHQTELRAAGRHMKEPPNFAFLEGNTGYRVLQHC